MAKEPLALRTIKLILGTGSAIVTITKTVWDSVLAHLNDTTKHLPNASTMTLDGSGNLSCAQGFAGLQTDGDFGYVYLSTQDDNYRFKIGPAGIDLYAQSGTNWLLIATLPITAGVNTLISNAVSGHNTSTALVHNILPALLKALNAGVSYEAGDGTDAGVNGLPSIIVLARALTANTRLELSAGGNAVDGGIKQYFPSQDIIFYRQICDVNGVPHIYVTTPSNAGNVDYGAVITNGQKCVLAQSSYCVWSGLSTSGIYFNVFDSGSYNNTQVWSGNTSFYTLDIATVAVAATSSIAATVIGDRRIKILVAGKYKITGWVKFAAPANGQFYLRILKNSSIRGWWDQVRSIQSPYQNMSEVLVFDCAVNDLIMMEIYNGSQATIDGFMGSLSIEKIG